MTNPWVGLRPFKTSEADLFFGRANEVQIISNLVATLPTLIVYAPSGTGKSSLINAGLLPLLLDDQTHVPVVVADPQDDIVASTRKALAEAGWQAQADLDFLELLEQHWMDTDRRTVVIIDQFEERINAGVSADDLFAAMAKLVHSGTDSACVLISVREDYLASLEPLMRRVPGLLNGSYRIPSLSREALEEAVYGPLRQVGSAVEVEQRLVTRTIDDLKERSSGSQEPGEQRFEPGFFQIIWSTMWRASQEANRPKLGLKVYQKLGGAGQILKNFTSGILNALEPAQTAMFWAISRYLVLPTGAKTALTVDDLTSLLQESDYLDPYDEKHGTWLHGLPYEELTRLIRGVMRRLTASGTPILQRVIRLNREEFELLHDLLGQIILRWREEYRLAQFKAAQDFKDLIQRGVDEKFHRPRPLTARSLDPIVDLRPFADEARERIAALGALIGENLTERTAVQALEEVRQILVLSSFIDRLVDERGYDYEIKELADHVGADLRKFSKSVIHAALNHESEPARNRMQLATTYLNTRVGVSLSRLHKTPWTELLGATLGVGILSLGSIAVAEFVFQSAITHLDITYHLLTMAHAAILVVGFYAMLWDEHSYRSGRWSTSRRLFACLIPFVDIKKFRLLPFTWPLPTLALQGVGVSTAWIFQRLGWAPTAGYIEGIIVGLIGIGVAFIAATEP
ncbi:nSTAND1 domain-containing NTPase [Kibdelosporangium aridum]|uniref:nSTAND1 domain-containing NTPase n=1 Tax=Kibdelosporangium aridum TaxID=2030 RepID=UPI0005244939